MQAYVSLVEEKRWIAVNGLWAVLKEKSYVPDEVYVIAKKEGMNELKDLVEDFGDLLNNHDIDSSVESYTFEDVEELCQTLEDISEENTEITLDLSAASEYMTAASMVNFEPERFSHVFYLSIDESTEDKMPLPMIDKNKTYLEDLKVERTEVER